MQLAKAVSKLLERLPFGQSSRSRGASNSFASCMVESTVQVLREDPHPNRRMPRAQTARVAVTLGKATSSRPEDGFVECVLSFALASLLAPCSGRARKTKQALELSLRLASCAWTSPQGFSERLTCARAFGDVEPEQIHLGAMWASSCLW